MLEDWIMSVKTENKPHAPLARHKPRRARAAATSPRKRTESDLERIIREQGVKPFKAEDFLGKWPGEKDDGFEEALARWRKEDKSNGHKR